MKKLPSILLILVSILTPLLLVTSGMRIALTPLFINIEYRLPNFPFDSYGFTQEDRLKLANYSIEYLLGKYSDDDFTNLSFPDGSPLFNQREIIHMVDVRILTEYMLVVWRMLILFFSVVTILGWQSKQLSNIIKAMARGGSITLVLIFGLLLYVLLNFDHLFTLFHRIFFEGDSWLFYYSDTLIRLFPIKFWQDLFIFVGGFGLVGSLFLIYLEKRYAGKKQ